MDELIFAIAILINSIAKLIAVIKGVFDKRS